MTETVTPTPGPNVIPDTYPPVLLPDLAIQYNDDTMAYRLDRRQIHRDADELIGDHVWQVRLVGYTCPNPQCIHHTIGLWLLPGVNQWRKPYCPKCYSHKGLRYTPLRETGQYRLSLQPAEKEVGFVVQCKCLISVKPAAGKQAFTQGYRTVVRKPYRVHLSCSICHGAPEVKEVVSQVPRWAVPGTAQGPYLLLPRK